MERHPEHGNAVSRRTAVLVARAAVLNEDKSAVLLVFHDHPDRKDAFWTFPGGGVEGDETYARAAVRELEEETGLTVRLSGIVYVQEFVTPSFSEVFFLASVEAGELSLGEDPEYGDDPGHLKDVRWVPLEELNTLDVRPAELRDALVRGVHNIPLLPVPDKLSLPGRKTFDQADVWREAAIAKLSMDLDAVEDLNASNLEYLISRAQDRLAFCAEIGVVDALQKALLEERIKALQAKFASS